MSFAYHHVICTCTSADHDIRFVKDTRDGDVWVEVQLVAVDNIWRRIYNAIRYIFGYRSKYGHWDTTLISKEEAKKLQHFLKRYSEQG